MFLVLDNKGGGQQQNPSRDYGGATEELNFISRFNYRVMYVKFQNQVVIFHFLQSSIEFVHPPLGSSAV
jgi:phage-related protein